MRLFVAFDLPDEVRRNLVEVMALLRPTCRGARWVRPESMHLTLKFIGHAVKDEDTQKLADVRAALHAIRSDDPVELHFRGVGFFSSARRPRVVWCGVKASPNLARIASDLETALEPLGIPRESREFVPHLTLARIESPRGTEGLARAVEKLESSDFGGAIGKTFCLFESKLKPSGAEYRKIDSYDFVRGAE